MVMDMLLLDVMFSSTGAADHAMEVLRTIGATKDENKVLTSPHSHFFLTKQQWSAMSYSSCSIRITLDLLKSGLNQ